MTCELCYPKSLELRDIDERAGGLTDRGGASSGGILVRIKREGLDTAQRDFLGPSICAPHPFLLFVFCLCYGDGWDICGDVVGMYIDISRCELTRVVLKSGGSDVEAACLHVSPSIFYTTRRGFVLALLETCNY